MQESPDRLIIAQLFLDARVAEGRGPYSCPREVRFLVALPRTHLGKVNRHALAQSAGAAEAP